MSVQVSTLRRSLSITIIGPVVIQHGTLLRVTLGHSCLFGIKFVINLIMIILGVNSGEEHENKTPH